MKTYALDFETYYDRDCSIKKLGPLGYFSHHSFDAYMVSVVGDDGLEWVGHPKDFDWQLLEGQRVLSHNASFDETLYLYGVTQSWWPEVKPAEWHCTADMAAACGLPRSLKNSTAIAFDLEISKSTRDNMSGKTWDGMSEDFKREVEEYAIKDSVLCLRLWKAYESKWPQFERDISNLNRRIVQRGIPIDIDALRKGKETINELLFETEKVIPWADEKPLLSRKAFDEHCIQMGIEPPASLAKTDVDAQKWIRAHGHKYKWIESVTNWRRINAIKKKLDSFEYATMPDNRYYGGIMYYGGHTGRFSGSGGNLNLQNLPRDEMFGVNMRNLITAPKGRKLVVVDLSQIEVRTLCWLSKDEETMAAIQASDDIYEAFAIQFGLWSKDKGVLKKEDPKLRHKVKALVLGCFGAGTKVLTQRGWVNIVDVRDSDTVWDGNQWVNHEGLLHQGIQETVTAHGLEATPDHEILTEHGWQEWSKVLQSEKDLKSALSTATLPYSVTNITEEVQESQVGTLLSNVVAVGKGWLTGITSNVVSLLLATCALRKIVVGQSCVNMDTPKSFLIKNTGRDYSTGSAQYTTDASTLTIKDTFGMAEEAYGYTKSGSIIDQRSLDTLSPLKGGINRIWNWIVSTMTKVTNQITLDSLLGKKTATTKDQSRTSKKGSTILKQKSYVYDLKNCGPNNRFTVLTDYGPILVHNCGYGAGPKRFSELYDMPLEEAEEAVELYRDRLHKVPRFWDNLNLRIKGAMDKRVLTLKLPSGRTMSYPNLQEIMNKGRSSSYLCRINRNGQLRKMNLWGGVLAENMSQALARDIFSHMMLEIDKAGIDIIFHVHDEVICECNEEKAEETLQTIIKIMSTPPEWVPDIPLDAEGEILTKYQK